jgi:mono/diheme cytochrome c family protein
MKSLFRLYLAGPLLAAALLSSPASAQENTAPNTPPTGAPQPGRAMMLGQCLQCHTDAMFRDQRQDRRAWEATIYRMIGRGALWSPEEIGVMSDYLGTEYGTAAKPAAR